MLQGRLRRISPTVDAPASARVLTLSYRAGHHVGFALRGALNAALAEGRPSPLAPRDDEEINERVAAPHTKRACLPMLAARVRRGWEPARAAALGRDRADYAYGLDIGGGTLGWGFVA